LRPCGEVPHRGAIPWARWAVPADAYLRCADGPGRFENFPHQRPQAALPTSSRQTVLIKKAAAEVNAAARTAGTRRFAKAIVTAADEILKTAGCATSFVVDVYQARRGAPPRTKHECQRGCWPNRASGASRRGPRHVPAGIHPNDHVNMGPSRPTTCFRRRHGLRCSSARLALVGAARDLADSLALKSDAFRPRDQDRPHAPAGRRADHPSVRSSAVTPRCIRRGGRGRSFTRPRQLEELNIGAHRCRHRVECRRRIPARAAVIHTSGSRRPN